MWLHASQTPHPPPAALSLIDGKARSLPIPLQESPHRCALSLPAARPQIKRLKAINATASFTMASLYPMAKDYFSIYQPQYIK